MRHILQPKAGQGHLECAANGGALQPEGATRTGKAAASPPHSKGGFTFIEILATLSLLSIVLPSIMAGISLSLSAAQLARQQAQAANLGYAKLTELTIGNQWQSQELSGDFSPDHPEYRWTAEIADWDGYVLQELDVTVTWQREGRQRSVTFSTLVQTQTGATQ